MKYQYVVERILDHYPHLTAEEVASLLRHASFVSLGRRYIYYQVPKAASTQMVELLRALEKATPIVTRPADGHRETRRDMFIHARSCVPLPSLIDLDSKTQREVLESPDFLRMTIVRNPYSRLISAWRNKILLCEPALSSEYLRIKGRLPDFHNKSLVSFNEFWDYVEHKCDVRTCNIHWRRQVDHTFFPALNFNFIGKVERFGEVLSQFERHIGLPEPLPASRRNASFPAGGASYNQELADRVYQLYQKDFEVFGYDRDSWRAARGSKGEEKAGVPEETFFDEIIERNLVILGLYKRLEGLEVLSRRVSRLHLLPIVNSLVAFRSAWRRIGRRIAGGSDEMFRPAGSGEERAVPSA